MPLNQTFVGRVYPPTPPYEVSREKIKEFATAIGATDAAYLDPAAARALGYPDVIAPVTFPIVLTLAAIEQITNDPELGLDFTRVVHGDQRFQYVRPVCAGDKLCCTSVIEQLTHRAGNDFFTARAEINDVKGDLVVTVWSMLVVRGATQVVEGHHASR